MFECAAQNGHRAGKHSDAHERNPMKTTLSIATVVFAIIASISVPVLAQTPAPTAIPAAKTGKQHLRPKATTKGVGTKKIENGAKNAGRETEGTVGKDAGKVKKSLSKDSRKVRNAFGKRKSKATPTPAPAVKP